MFDELTRRGIARAILVTISMARIIHADSAVSFNRDIRPILSDKCFTCHGPDAANRKSKLRFDHEDGADTARITRRDGTSAPAGGSRIVLAGFVARSL